MKRFVLLAIVVAGVAGCQTSSADWQSATLSTTDFQAVFAAAQEVIGHDYTITKANFSQAVIETAPQEFQKTGTDRAAGGYISGGTAPRYRRSVICHLEREAGEITVNITVAVQRESTEQAAMLLVGQEGDLRQRQLAERQQSAGTPNQATYWADVGRDRQIESRLLDRIRARFGRSAAGGVQPLRDAGRGSATSAPIDSGTSAEELRKEVEQFSK